MNIDTLDEIIYARLQDFSNQHKRLVSLGKLAEANLLEREGRLITETRDNNQPFFYLKDLRSWGSSLQH